MLLANARTSHYVAGSRWWERFNRKVPEAMNDYDRINAWIEWASTKRGLIASSVDSSARTFQALLQWAEPRSLAKLTADDLEHFLARPRATATRTAAPATMKRELAALRSLWKWLHARNMIPKNPTLQLVTASVHNEAPKPVPDDQWSCLWAADLPDVERVAYGLAYFSGLRREEICNLTVGQFSSYPRPTIVDVIRKGGKRQNIAWGSCVSLYAQRRPDLLPATEALSDALERLLRARRDRLLLAAWDTNDDGWFQPDQMNKRLTRRCRTLGLPHASPHQFRHSFATNLIRMGIPIPTVARLCGHASIQMTMRYVDTGEDPLGDMLEEENILNGAQNCHALPVRSALRTTDRWGRR